MPSPFLEEEVPLALPYGRGWEPAGALAVPDWRAEVQCMDMTPYQPSPGHHAAAHSKPAPMGSHCCHPNHPQAKHPPPALHKLCPPLHLGRGSLSCTHYKSQGDGNWVTPIGLALVAPGLRQSPAQAAPLHITVRVSKACPNHHLPLTSQPQRPVFSRA